MISYRKRHTFKKNRWNIYLPIMTFIVIGIFFYFSNAYRPSWTFNWNGIRPEIKDTVKLIEEYGGVTGFVVGYHCETPQQFYRRIWFMHNANEFELLKLTDYPHGAVKSTAYEGLLRKKSGNSFQIMTKSLNDTTTFVDYTNGCLGKTQMICEYLMEEVLYLDDSPPQPEVFYAQFNLTKDEIRNIKAIYKQRISKKNEYINNYYDWRK